ncbi:AbrB/MazE/SpoVT family DNA-binding domain-containing protein [Variovorax saccharolyticus]|uniref:AbrB/MazE/SpoVT family DNA-binding domain-containing protein n=1 Tax=Variovorax saccharolyticus TaxID=3053516 RepID=UPI0025777DB2|nr:AbrB/MazE/SpoVT family DNA-binding domain-containing protein [Variovorax sp. J31P216]MDM0029863.1 AbrB/MazE/SpoVT family DNA-binding domain-containing protein [Variovorax sp. J31P216]
MSESTISATGRTTIPADVRARMGAKPGTRISWNVLSDGTIIVRAKTRSLRNLAGLLNHAAPDGRSVSIDEMSR